MGLAGALAGMAVQAQTGPINIDATLNHWNGSYVGQVTRELPAGDYLLHFKGLADTRRGLRPTSTTPGRVARVVAG